MNDINKGSTWMDNDTGSTYDGAAIWVWIGLGSRIEGE